MEKKAKSALRMGPAGWNYRDWYGVFYPAKKPRGFSELAYLAQYCDCVEINSSFYRPFTAKSAQSWLEQVAGNEKFLFTGKLWRGFTHDHAANAQDERAVREGFDVLQDAGKLGGVLVQFPFSFHNTGENRDLLSKLLDQFHSYPLVVEVRHATWDKPEILDLFREKKAGFCNIDQPVIGRSIQPTSYVTSQIGYVRFHGRRYDTWFNDQPDRTGAARYDYKYSKEELSPWADKIREMEQSSEKIFVITNNHPLAKSMHAGMILLEIITGKKMKMPEPLLQTYPELEKIATELPPKTTLF